MAGKLLINLNNGMRAVAGATIAEPVRNRTLRRYFARMLGLPNFLVLRVASNVGFCG